MSNPTISDIHADVGIAYIHVVGTTTTIVNTLISHAQDDIRTITGTTSGSSQDRAIRFLADAYVMGNAMTALDPNKANDLFDTLRQDFLNKANQSLQKIGKSLDGHKIQFTQVNP